MKPFKKENILRSEQGFSLIEVLIAIVILSFLMLSIYQIIDNSSESNFRIKNEDRALIQFESAMNIIQTDIEYMYTPLFYETDKKADEAAYKKAFLSPQGAGTSDYRVDESYGETNQLGEYYIGYSASNIPIPKFINENKTSIAFLTSAGRRLVKDTKQSNLYWVIYELRDNPEPINKEAPYILTRATVRQDLYNPNLDLKDAKAHPILDNVKTLEFNFFNTESKKFVESTRLLDNDLNTPRLIKVEVETEGPKGDSLFANRVFRPLFPLLDTKEILKKKYVKDKSQTPTGSLSGGTPDKGKDE